MFGTLEIKSPLSRRCRGVSGRVMMNRPSPKRKDPPDLGSGRRSCWATCWQYSMCDLIQARVQGSLKFTDDAERGCCMAYHILAFGSARRAEVRFPLAYGLWPQCYHDLPAGGRVSSMWSALGGWICFLPVGGRAY
eukprot:462826-Amphidinium_carterae.1